MKDTYSSKVIEAWIPQLPSRLANIRICIFIFDNGLKHLDNIILMGKETTLRILSDGAGHRHQHFASPDFGGDGFLGSFSPGVTNAFFNGRSSFPSAFLLVALLPTALEADEDSPTLVFSSFFLWAAVVLILCLAASISIKAKDEYAQVMTKRKRVQRWQEIKRYLRRRE